jgi:hypothetical protein
MYCVIPNQKQTYFFIAFSSDLHMPLHSAKADDLETIIDVVDFDGDDMLGKHKEKIELRFSKNTSLISVLIEPKVTKYSKKLMLHFATKVASAASY